MSFGILKQGFTIQNDVYRIHIPKQSIVLFSSHPEPTIQVRGLPIAFIRRGREWFADVYGLLMHVKLSDGVPYPLSYFKS